MCKMLANEEILEKIKDFSKKHYDDSFDHGWPHVERVIKIAITIARDYDYVDKNLLIASAYLHDIGRKYEAEFNKNHAQISVEIAKPFLKQIQIDECCIKQIEHVILAHSYTLGVVPETNEAKILSDADKIDALGAVGVVRAILFGCKNNRSFEKTFNHFFDKLLELDKVMHSDTARKIAQERIRFIKKFIHQLKKEM
ncbi:MAG: HD domain-containing protein [Candidatus Asgardarchaeia archaeon]